jgi:jumonji domain-containing protein 2
LNCKNFLRHKTTLINPYKLKQKHPDLKISKAYQGPNEFIVVFSGSYHCGFNSGKNIAEAVNFATKDWLKKL